MDKTTFLRSLLPAAVLVGITIAPLAGQAAPATETRAVPEFTAIATSGSMALQISQGVVASVQVTADDKVLSHVVTVVEAGRFGPTLHIRMKREGWGWGGSHHSGAIKVVVVTPRLTGVASSGAGDIRIDAMQTPALQLALSGSGNAGLAGLNTDELGISIAGSGDVRADGRSARLNVSIAGSGDVRLADLRSDEVTVKIAGSGDAAVQAHKTLSVSIAGSGNVVYSGDATVKKSVAGNGTVSKR